MDVYCDCNGSRRRSRNGNIVGNKQLDTYYRSRLKSDQCIDDRHEAVVGHAAQYNTGNARFVEHEYSYIADLHVQPPPCSTPGPDFGASACRVVEEVMEQSDGEFDGSGQGLSGSGQPRVCRPMVECGAQQVPGVHRSAVQLVDHSQQNVVSPAPAFSSVVSLADDDTVAVRGVAPLPRTTAAPPSNTGPPRVYTRNASFPLVSGY